MSDIDANLKKIYSTSTPKKKDNKPLFSKIKKRLKNKTITTLEPKLPTK
jgi:hypothetical protein